LCLWLFPVLFLLASPAPSAASPLWGLDASLGYLFFSEAKGAPWFSDTEFPCGALSVGGDAWAVGVSVDYAVNSRDIVGGIQGFLSAEKIEEKLTNASFRLFARIFPGGRERTVAPYLGLGVGPTITSLTYTGASSGCEEKDSVVRISYAVSVGSRLRFGKSPFSVFFEGSFGGLGALRSEEPSGGALAPRKALDFVCVAAGLGVAF
jgi:hypothetical protein